MPVAIREHKPLIIPSGHAQGKDWLSSSIVLWFTYNYYPSKTIVTAPTSRQVEEIIWGEIEERWRNKQIPLEGRLLSDKLDIAPEHFVIGFTTKETGNMVGKFQGFHSPNILVIASEAQAISDKIYEQMDGVLTSENSLQILIGNPLVTTGKFAREIKRTMANIVIHLNCLESPNYRERREVIPGMASYHWVERKREDWGEDHPLWYARVLGRLPKTSIDSVFSHDLLDSITDIEPNVVERKLVVSCDPARQGLDECVILAGVSGRSPKSDIMPQSKADVVTSHILQMIKDISGETTDGVCLVIEEDGLGGPICDFTRGLIDDGVDQYDALIGGKAEDDLHYKNLRAEIWMYARDQAEKKLVSIPEADTYLREELTEVKYFYTPKGKIQIEKKEDVKERLGRSPNRADAWVLYVWGLKHAQVIKKGDKWVEDAEGDSGVGVY